MGAHGCLIVGCSDSRILFARTLFRVPSSMVSSARWWRLVWAYGAILPDGWRHGRLFAYHQLTMKSIISINNPMYTYTHAWVTNHKNGRDLWV